MKEYQIIADSCCDFTPQLREQLEVVSVPLTLRLGEREFVDDETLSLPQFMADMAANSGQAGSAAPAPMLYQQAMQGAKASFAITLSSQLSASHSSALLGKQMAEEAGAENIFVLDSKSASAGETLISIKLHKLIQQGLPLPQIVERITSFIDSMKTYFVLENYDNLQKNGRLSKIKSTLISLLHMRLVMGADGNGNIALFGKAFGIQQAIQQLLSLIDKSGKDTSREMLVIAHCNNQPLAEQIVERIRQRFQFEEIFIVPTGGLSSLYADNKGVILAF